MDLSFLKSIYFYYYDNFIYFYYYDNFIYFYIFLFKLLNNIN
jgi:hypothetical protein